MVIYILVFSTFLIGFHPTFSLFSPYFFDFPPYLFMFFTLLLRFIGYFIGYFVFIDYYDCCVMRIEGSIFSD